MSVDEAPDYARVLRAYELLKVKYDKARAERGIYFDDSQDLRNELADNQRDRRIQTREGEVTIARVLALLSYAESRLRTAKDFEAAEKVADWADHFRQGYFPVTKLKEQIDTLEAWCSAFEKGDQSAMADLHMASRSQIRRLIDP